VAQLGARLDGIEEVVGSNPIGSTNFKLSFTTSYYVYILPNKALASLVIGANVDSRIDSTSEARISFYPIMDVIYSIYGVARRGTWRRSISRQG
jgi:hypothetical protein